MTRNSWQSALLALAFVVVCVLGCSKSNADVPKADATNKNANSNADVAPVMADISGSYNVTGTNENGSPYRGALEVIKHGDVYQFRWNAGRQYDGIGIPNGGVVAVAFTEGSDGKGCGVVNYQILSDGTLDGKWGYWGLNESGTEKAHQTSGSGLPGEYNTAGANPDGGQYKGRVTVAPKGGGYTFAWSNQSTGFGIQRSNNISVGVGGAKCAFVAYAVKGDGTLDGVWGGYGSQKTGTEKAVRSR
jgi:hypothetical protein